MQTLRYYLHKDIFRRKPDRFSWFSVLKKMRSRRSYNFIFWWRIAWVWYRSENSIKRGVAKYIYKRLQRNYSVEIPLSVEIGAGFFLPHPLGIVIRKEFVAGTNFTLRQNTTIGSNRINKEKTIFGDNVTVGANSCIIGNNIVIGDNVQIGAMSFVNKSVPDNTVIITEKENREW